MVCNQGYYLVERLPVSLRNIGRALFFCEEIRGRGEKILEYVTGPMKRITELVEVTRGEVRLKEPMSKHTSFRIGGPADFWIEPVDFEDLANLIAFLKKKKMSWIVFGNGTDVIVKDSGFKGAVINLQKREQAVFFRSLFFEGDTITAGAGVTLQEILEKALSLGLAGVEFTAGIPGTIGGAVVTNAGGRAGEISNIVKRITILNSKVEKQDVSDENLKFTYRNCHLPPESIIVEVYLQLRIGKKDDIRERISEILNYRRQTQPLNYYSAGCIFKNPDGKSAGELIESAGLAGRQIGDAQVSTKHANFIINRGSAKASDVIALMEMIESEVFKRFSIRLEREVRIIGD